MGYLKMYKKECFGFCLIYGVLLGIFLEKIVVFIKFIFWCIEVKIN